MQQISVLCLIWIVSFGTDILVGFVNVCLVLGTIHDIDVLLEFAATGVYCQFDLFGTECSYYQLNPTVDMPSDAERINRIVKMVENGLEDQILMSHDVHTKHRLVRESTLKIRSFEVS